MFRDELDNAQREWCVNLEPVLELKFDGHEAACHFSAARTDILVVGEERKPIPAELAPWPTGRPTDEQASAPMACTPDEPREPTRISDEAVVDDEGELILDPDAATTGSSAE
jgi:hypothetical protein